MNDLLDRWGCTDPVLIADTRTSRVVRVRLEGGGTAVVKDLKPIGSDEITGADYLTWRDGRGAVRLLAREGMTTLLEDAGPVSLLDRFEELGDAGATRILLDVIGELHEPGPLPLPDTLPRLEEWFGSLFAASARAAHPLIVEAATQARELLSDQRDVRPLHGDLHHANVHRSDRGWLAIDPKGLIGDAAYDVANLFYNPLHRDDLRTDPARIRAIASAFADRFDRDAATVLRWGFVHACLSASWHIEDGSHREAERSLGVGAAIRRALGDER